MFKITRPGPSVLVLSQKSLPALIRLGIWVCVVVIFYVAVFASSTHDDTVSSGATGRNVHEWLFLLFPIFLLPYLFNCIRAIAGSGDLIIDGPSRSVSRRSRPLASFADIRELRLRAVNATCEEFCLSATLRDGRHITLLESRGSPGIAALTEEIASLIGVKITRAA